MILYVEHQIFIVHLIFSMFMARGGHELYFQENNIYKGHCAGRNAIIQAGSKYFRFTVILGWFNVPPVISSTLNDTAEKNKCVLTLCSQLCKFRII